jgi:hypothetical protein
MQKPPASPSAFDMFLPFLITYGTIIFSMSLLAVIVHWKFLKFREWFAQPINKFWLVWIILVVCSGGMVSARLRVPLHAPPRPRAAHARVRLSKASLTRVRVILPAPPPLATNQIAMMIFPGADGVMGWGLLKYDGAFKGPAWIAANEVNTQIIVLLFTMSALVNQPPLISELFLTFSHPDEVDRLFPRTITLQQRRVFLALANCNCIFMYPLTFSTWMINVARRPFLYTAMFLPLSFGSGIIAGIYLSRVTPKARAGDAPAADTMSPRSGSRDHDDYVVKSPLTSQTDGEGDSRFGIFGRLAGQSGSRQSGSVGSRSTGV